MDRHDVDRWLDAYVMAWKRYDPEEIAALFSDDVTYRYHPYDEPVRGRDAVVKSWLGEDESDGASDRDARAPMTPPTGRSPSTATRPSRPVTRYRSAPGGPVGGSSTTAS